jgi:hypothetical protein
VNEDSTSQNLCAEVLVGTLRSRYGSHFAAGCSESDRLTDILDQLDEPSLTDLARDYEAGKLAQAFPN